MNDSWDNLDIDIKDTQANKYTRANSPRNIATHYFSEQATSSYDKNDIYKRTLSPRTEQSFEKYERRNLPTPNAEPSHGQYLGTSYGNQDRTKRVFGQNFKYMKHYVRERRNSLTKPEIVSENNRNHVTANSEMTHRRRNSEGNAILQTSKSSQSNLQRFSSTDFLSDDDGKEQPKTFQRQTSLDSKTALRFKFQTDRENRTPVRPSSAMQQEPTKTSQRNDEQAKMIDFVKSAEQTNKEKRPFTSYDFRDTSDHTFRPNFVRQLLSHDNDKDLRVDRLINSEELGQNFVKISKHKLQKIQETNDMALRRKDELQRELLDALKKISQLEVSQTHSYTEKRELMVELRIAKERLGDAEREAANSIGRASKLEQDLNESTSNCNRYLEELKKTQEKLSSLEDEFCKTKANYLFECTKKEDEESRIEKLELQLDNAKEEILKLKSFLSVKEKEFEEACNELENVHREKKIEQREKMSLLHDKENIEENYNKAVHKTKNNEKTIEQLQANLKDQKTKFDIIIKSRINLESELNTMHDELSKEKVEKQQILIDMKKIENENNQFKSVLLELKDRNDELKYENQDLKNKITEIGLYREMLEENRFRPKSFVNKKREINMQNENATENFDSRPIYKMPSKMSRRHIHDIGNSDVFDYQKKYASAVKTDIQEDSKPENTDRVRSNIDDGNTQENMLNNGESILKSSRNHGRNNKMQWDRSAFDMQKNSYLFDESLEAEDYGDEISEGDYIDEENNNNSNSKKAIGVTFAPDVETFDDSDNNYSAIMHKGNQDLADAFMQ